jgi:hypothetical protein
VLIKAVSVNIDIEYRDICCQNIEYRIEIEKAYRPITTLESRYWLGLLGYTFIKMAEPETTADRLFSKAGLVIPDRRSALLPLHAEQISFTAKLARIES